MFHIGMWRERFRAALAATAGDRPFEPPGSANEINDAELPHGIGTPLSDAAARADHLLTEILDLYDKVGDRPIKWFSATSTSEAVLRNSYTHPRTHLYEYLKENGDDAAARKLLDDALTELEVISAPPRLIEAMTAVKRD